MKKVLLSFCLLTVVATLKAQQITKPCTGGVFNYCVVALNSDDKMVIKVNGNPVKTIETEGDPRLNDRIDITPYLQLSVKTGFVNELVVEGYNGPTGFHDFPVFAPKIRHNPSHFEFAVEKKCSTTGEYENIIPLTVIRGEAPNVSTPEKLVFLKTYPIIKE